MPFEHFCLKKNNVKNYWDRVLKNVTTSDDMDEMLDHGWFPLKSSTISILLCLHFC